MSNQLIRISLDLETMSLEDNAAIIQIGACTLDQSRKFLMTIDPRNSEKYGHVDTGTMAWWDQQDPEVRKRVFGGTTPLPEALNEFISWIHHMNEPLENFRFYTKGGQDWVWLKNAWYKVFGSFPLHYRSPCDMRTLKDVREFCEITGMPEFKPVQAHDALLDAMAQADEITWTLTKLAMLRAGEDDGYPGDR